MSASSFGLDVPRLCRLCHQLLPKNNVLFIHRHFRRVLCRLIIQRCQQSRDHRDPDGMLLASAMANQIVSPLLIFSMKAHWRVGTFFHLPSWSVEVQVRPRLADDEECSMINDVAIVSQIVTLSGKPVASLLHSNDVDASLNAISTVHPNANRSNAQTQTRAFHRSTSASSASSASQYVY